MKNKDIQTPKRPVAKSMRPLRWNERVRTGDFVKAERNGFEPWVGPSGFRADAFVKQIYRQQAVAAGIKS